MSAGVVATGAGSGPRGQVRAKTWSAAEPGALGKPRLLCLQATECEAKLCLRNFTFILRTLGAREIWEQKRDSV